MRCGILLAGAFVAVLCAIWRLTQFGQIDLVSDQAFFTQWIVRLSYATHILPPDAPGAGFVGSLMQDDKGFLSILLGQVYQAHAVLFTVVSVALYLIASMGLGASVETVIAVSILCSAAWLWMIFAFPAIAGTRERRIAPEAVGIGGTALLLGCASSFFNIFSAMGPHNAGVMLLVAAVLVTQTWITRVRDTFTFASAGRLTLWMFLIQWAAIYAHYTNVFLLPAATVLAIAVQPGGRFAARLGLIIRYSAVTVVILLPAVGLALLHSGISGSGTNVQTFGGLMSNLVLSDPSTVGDTVGERVQLWFRDIVAFYSVPGLVMGIAGVAGLAWRNHLMLPAAVVAAHFLAGAFLQVFTQYDRTAAYVLPMLMLGAGWCLTVAMVQAGGLSTVRTLSRHIALAIAGLVSIMLAWHIVVEFPRLKSPDTVRNWGQLAVPASWKPVIAEIDSVVPAGATLIPWNYGLSHQYRATSRRRPGAITMMRPLETLLDHRKTGTLDRYIADRGLVFDRTRPAYLLAPARIVPEDLQQHLADVTGTRGFGSPAPSSVSLVNHWRLSRAKYLDRDVRLYRVSW